MTVAYDRTVENKLALISPALNKFKNVLISASYPLVVVSPGYGENRHYSPQGLAVSGVRWDVKRTEFANEDIHRSPSRNKRNLAPGFRKHMSVLHLRCAPPKLVAVRPLFRCILCSAMPRSCCSDSRREPKIYRVLMTGLILFKSSIQLNSQYQVYTWWWKFPLRSSAWRWVSVDFGKGTGEYSRSWHTRFSSVSNSTRSFLKRVSLKAHLPHLHLKMV